MNFSNTTKSASDVSLTSLFDTNNEDAGLVPSTAERRRASILSITSLLDANIYEAAKLVSSPAERRRSSISSKVVFSTDARGSKRSRVNIRTGLLTLKRDYESNLNKVSVTNWAETVETNIEQFRYPETVDEVIELVKTNDKIRCSGALHSCAPLIASDGIILSLTKLDGIISIDPKTKLVRLQSGVRIHDLCDALAPYGLAVGTLGTIDWQTISGAVMTGTHGGALTIPSLHDFVKSYTLVKPNGDIMKVTKDDLDPNLFHAMAPSMGVFGAVVEMEIEAVPLELLEAKVTAIPIEDVIKCFDNVMASNKYARFVVYPSIGKATVWTANPVDSREAAVANGATDHIGRYTNFRNDEEKAMLLEYLELCTVHEFEKADAILERVLESQVARLNHYVGQHNHVLCLERNNGIPHADIEFNLDYKKHKEVLRSVQKYCSSNRMPYYNYEIRTTKQDDAILSCCQGRDAMWIDFQAKADVAKEFFHDMESILKPFGFRKHWAKGTSNTDPTYLVQQFPRVAEFIKLMKSFDPMGKFRNTQLEAWFEVMDGLVTKAEEEEAAKNIQEEKKDD